MRMQDKVALVTGASGGLGGAICQEYADEGADCVVVFRTDRAGAEATAEAVRAAGRRAEVVQADVSNEAQVAAAVAVAATAFGRLDIAVAVAGIGGPLRSLLEISVEEFERVLATNVTGTFLTVRAAAALMAKSGGGKIITMSSIHGVSGTHYTAAYQASKAAIIAFTRGAAFDLAEHNIQVNAIAPGAVPVHKDPPPAEGSPLEQAWMQYTPLGRWGQPRDIARAAVYLGSSDSDWVTGQVLNIDGGISAGNLIPSFKHYGDKPKMAD
jgi:NAD(P)-dependent dehydrogenase (short-subunit alcohol dehydrogenase family)